MKRCSKCGQTYTDKDLNFCYNDGELLTSSAAESSRDTGYGQPPTLYADDPAPTGFLGSARVTSETKWPLEPAQQYSPPYHQQQAVPTQFSGVVSPSQGLAMAAMIVGIVSIPGFCCYAGFYLGPAAMIMGIIALVQIKNDPARYGGKGLAIAGLVTGAVSLVVTILFIILAVAVG